MLQCLDHSCRHGLVVFLSVAYVGEYLCESFLVVYLYELAVLLKCLFLGIILVDVGRSIVVVCLAVHKRVERQTVGERRILVGPS